MKKKKPIPFEFVLEELSTYPQLQISTKPMFGCTAVYNGPKIIFVLRDRPSPPADNGVWIATTSEHHESLRKELPIIKSITVFGSGETGWQVLSALDPQFESCVYAACQLVAQNDTRIGKTPKPKVRRSSKAKKAAPSKKTQKLSLKPRKRRR